MSRLRFDCPYCRTRNVAVELSGRFNRTTAVRSEADCLLVCAHCHRGALGTFSGPRGVDVIALEFLRTVHPAPDAPPQHLPEHVGKRYSEAVSIMGTAAESAGMMFRKTLETALKTIRPTDTGNLKTRINKAADAGTITKDLAEWAHRIRLDGNEAAHEDEPISSDEIQALQRFTELVLLYMFTLPGMLQAWSEGKGSATTPD